MKRTLVVLEIRDDWESRPWWEVLGLRAPEYWDEDLPPVGSGSLHQALVRVLVEEELAAASDKWPRRLGDIPRRFVYDRNGDPKADGPACATCGALAAFDSHPACERIDGSLLVWRTREMEVE